MMPKTIPDHGAWRPWHPAELGARLCDVSRPWCIVGGWALDLWHGVETRDHEDLEFTVLREDIGRFRDALQGVAFHTVGNGIVEYLPDDQEPPADIWQIWCLDIADERWKVDMMVEPGTPDIWAYKRDPGITRPRADMVLFTPDGLPYLAPEGVLLFKAKYQRAKDEADFANAVAKLLPAQRAWLTSALEAMHPGHDWLRSL